MRTIVLVAGVALASTGVALAVGPPQPPIPAGGSTPTTGLVGFVSRGPVRPLCRPAERCFRPARVTVMFRIAGHTAAQVSTRPSGAYHVALAPGLYTVWARLTALQRLRPSSVLVRAGAFRRVDFALVSGIDAVTAGCNASPAGATVTAVGASPIGTAVAPPTSITVQHVPKIPPAAPLTGAPPEMPSPGIARAAKLKASATGCVPYSAPTVSGAPTRP
jgi:hypothetical protein